MIAVSTSQLAQILAEVDGLLRAGRVGAAQAAAVGAVRRGAVHPLLLHLSGDALLGAGDGPGAVRCLEAAGRLAPAEPAIHTSLGRALLATGQPAAAILAFTTALEADDRSAAALHGRGLGHERLGDIDAARRDWQAAVEAAPSWPDPLSALASLEGRVGRPERARHWARRALELRPGDAAASLALASADVADRAWAPAEARLTRLLADGLPEDGGRALALSLRADALTGLGQTDAAFAGYEAANAIWRRRADALPGETALARVRRLHVHYAAAQPASWTPTAGRDEYAPVQRHVFLMGFPRSGTTLLERVLGAHPAVAALEERSTLAQAAETLMSDNAGLRRLDALGPGEAAGLRDAYWRDVAAAVAQPLDGKVFIDKLPLYAVRLPLIAKLFPDARVLFARRDPRDVVLSCFRQRFRLNRAMAEFLDLERTALFYDAVMRFAELCLPRCGLACHTVRYERLVRDFRSEVSAALRFLDLPWTDAVEGFAARGDARSSNTPSAQQVARGLYTDGIGQWRAFAPSLAPVMPILEPWVARFADPDVDASGGTL